MKNPNQRLNFLTIKRRQLRNELDEMKYRGIKADLPLNTNPPYDRSPGGWTIAITFLLIASIFLVAFAFTPESANLTVDEPAVSPNTSAVQSKNSDASVLVPTITLIPDYELFTFTGSEPGWDIVNDTVMGGRSQSSVEVDNDLSRMIFSGNVSLENNGGFASARSNWTAYNLEAYDGISMRMRGDGNLYRLRIRTEKTGSGLAYTAWVKPEADIWQEIYIPFAEMMPLYRDIIVPVAGPIDASSIRSFGLMVSDKQQDDFALEVDWIKAVSENRSLDMLSANLVTQQ